MINHDLKTWPDPFQAVWDGKKLFELRLRDDPGYGGFSQTSLNGDTR